MFSGIFSIEDRARIRAELIEYAAKDERIGGAAITGSAAVEREDRWSDIDLAFGITDAAEAANVLADFTAHVYKTYRALHHLDIRFGAWIYRVFLLPGALQADLAFVPAAEFRPLSPAFRLMLGTANDRQSSPAAAAATGELIGYGWLYALHARSCIARGRLWQAEYTISAMRDHALALACVRHGLPSAHGRGFDQLPGEAIAAFEGPLARQLDRAELMRVFRVVTAALTIEIRRADAELAERLHEPLASLTENCAEG